MNNTNDKNNTKWLLEDNYPNEEYYVAVLNHVKVNLMVKGLNPEVKDLFLYSAKELQAVSETAILTPSVVLINVEAFKQVKEKDINAKFLREVQGEDVTVEPKYTGVVDMVADLINKPQNNGVVPLEDSELITMLKDKGFEMPAFHLQNALKKESSGFKFFMSPSEVEYIKNLQEKSLPDFLHAYLKVDEAHNYNGKNKLLKEFAGKLAEDIKDFKDTAYALVCNSLNPDSLNKVFNHKPGKNLHTGDVVEKFAHALNEHDSCDSYKRHLLIKYISGFYDLDIIEPNEVNTVKKKM